MYMTSNFLFDNMSRIGNDDYDVSNINIQNTNACTHMLDNYSFLNPMSKTINLATNQPNVFCQGSPAGGIDGNNIDENSVLKFAPISKQKERVGAQERLFLTVPYLGRGLGDPEEEFRIRTGECDLNKKTVNNTMEMNFSEHHNYPLMDGLQRAVENSAYKIESDAMEGWVRGGMSAREFARNQDNKH